MLKYLWIVLFITQPLSVTAQKYAFEKVPDVPYGLNIVQDTRGYMWLYGEQGLYKYNGIDFYKFSEADGLPTDFMIRGMAVDKKGYIWAGSRKRGIAVIQPDTIVFYNENNGLLSNEIYDLYKDHQERVWATTPKGLISLTGDKFSNYPLDDIKPFDIFWENRKHNLFFFHSATKQALEFTEEQKLSRSPNILPDSLKLKGRALQAITDRTGVEWFVYSSGHLIRYDGKRFTKIPIPVELNFIYAYCLISDYQGNLWIGTNQGVIKYDGIKFKRLGVKEGFSDEKVLHIYEDQEQVLWLLTSGGVYKYYGEQLVFWDSIEKTTTPTVFAFLENKKDGSIWIGTEGQGVFGLNSDKIIQPLLAKRKAFGAYIYSIYQDQDNIFWIGTRGGLQRYDGEHLTTYTTKDGLANSIVNIIVENQGKLWLGHWHGGVTLYDGHTFKKIKDFEKQRVSGIIADHKQRVWVATRTGLFVQKKGKWHQANKNGGLHHSILLGVTEDYKGNIWVTTFRKGLYLYDHQTFRLFTEKDGLPLNTVYGMLADKNTGELWLHSNGISKLDLKKFYKTGQFKLQTIGKTEGNLGAFYQDSKGNIWFGNLGGFGKYDVRHGLPKSVPKLHLTSIKLFLKEVNWRKYTDSIHYHIPYQLNLPYNQNYLTFSFVGVTSRNAAKMRYQYKLEGNDQEWSPLSAKNEMTYSNLPTGDYKFLVKALSNEGEWSKTLEYSFRIQIPFWQAVWFYIMVALALVVLVIVLVQWRTRRIQKRNALLEYKVKERTEEIKAQAEELKQINERLVELDDFKQGVTGMIVHDLKNPLNSLLAQAKSPETRQSAQQMLHMVLNILDVQKLESTELQLHWDEFTINLLIKQALDQVTVLASQKNVHFQWNEQSSFVARADADLIQRVIINLLTNAIKHTPLNSIVYIQLEETPRQKLKLTVTDEGPGVPDKLSNKVFDKFFSSGAEKQAMIKSTGLGLTFCKLAIEAHEELIGVVNTTNKGASFWFTLPLVNRAATNNKAPLKQPENDFILTEEAKYELLPYAQLLAGAQVYEMGKIKNAIDQIKANVDTPIAQWKEKMLEATFSMNQEWYDALVKLITNQ